MFGKKRREKLRAQDRAFRLLQLELARQMALDGLTGERQRQALEQIALAELALGHAASVELVGMDLKPLEEEATE